MRKLLAATLLLICAAFLALASPDRTADLKKADQDWAKSVADRNLDQFMSFISDDAYMCDLSGKWMHGKDAIKADWTKGAGRSGLQAELDGRYRRRLQRRQHGLHARVVSGRPGQRVFFRQLCHGLAQR